MSRCRYLCALGAPIVSICAAAAAADPAPFLYSPPGDPILSAFLTIDTAGFNAHRMVGAEEVNRVSLLDPNDPNQVINLSSEFFGASAYGGAFGIDQGTLDTGATSAAIPPSFFPLLAGGAMGIDATLTDTLDGQFAIDTIYLTINTASSTMISTFEGGNPVSLSNNGFGIGVPDGGSLPGPLTLHLPAGITGTGFDEAISSKGIRRVPEPGAALLVGLIGLMTLGLRRRARTSSERGDQAAVARRSRAAASAGLACAALLATPRPATAQLVTHLDVEAYVCDVVLAGDCSAVTLWISETALDSDHAAIDLDPNEPDEIMPYSQTWMVMIDDMPSANFGHPVRWLYVNANGAEHYGPFIKEFPPSLISLSGGAEPIFRCRPLSRVLPCPTAPPPLPPPPAPGGPDKECLYAVLISGGIRNGPTAADGPNYPRYLRNIKSMYNKLRAAGFPKNRIWIYYADGVAVDADADGNNDVTGGATKANIRTRLQNLCAQLNPLTDILFVYTSNHGSKNAGLCLWDSNNNKKLDANEILTPDELKADTANCRVRRLFVMMDQCYSGQFTGITGDGNHKNTSVFTAATANQQSICRHYMSYWEGMNPATTKLSKMHEDVATAMAGAVTTCTGGANHCELCAVNADCPAGKCENDTLSIPQVSHGTAGNADIPLSTCVVYWDALPDQLHLRPYRRFYASLEPGDLTGVVEYQFQPMPATTVRFESLTGNVRFTSGAIIPDGSVAEIATDIDGQARAFFYGQSPGTALVRVTVDGSPLTNYAVFEVTSFALVLPGDCNRDGHIDLTDLSMLLSVFGTEDGCDMNGDWMVDLADLSILLANFGI